MYKKIIIVAVIISVISLLNSCGMTGKETEVEDITEAPFGYNAEGLLSTDSPTFNINDTTINLGHKEFGIVFALNNTKAYLSIAGRAGGADYDIYTSDLINGVWSEPTTNGVSILNDASGSDLVSFISEDGQRIYFSSDRVGSYGDGDIYIATMNSGVWQAPVNLGPTINTIDDEEGCIENEDSSEIYFCSDTNVAGDYDIFQASKVAGVWQQPTSDVFIKINKTNSSEYGIVLSSDKEALYFTSDRADGLWRFYRSYKLDNGWDYPVLIEFPVMFNSYTNVLSYISDSDNKIYFSSTALTAGDSIEDYNLWTIERK